MFVIISNIFVFVQFVVLCCLNLTAAFPHVFNDVYSSCEFDFYDVKDEHKIEFPNKLWTIETKEFILHYSLCKSVQAKCKNQTSSCVIQKNNNQLIDLGITYNWVDSENFVLESLNGSRCTPGGTYKLTINLECSDSVTVQPRLMTSNECNFEVSMMKPGCQPKCTAAQQNGVYLVDFRNFPKNIEVNSPSKNFSITLCGWNRNCKSRSISSCEIINGSVIPLANVESQWIKYKTAQNELSAKGSYKFEKVTRDVQVEIKCNWETELSHFIYKKPQMQGKHYKFELQSSFGCIKLPQVCIVSAIDNFQYNLTKLNKREGWHVSNVTQGTIVLNVCGALEQPVKNICSDQYSQVCRIDAAAYTNRGSIASLLSVTEGFIKMVFSSGSTCLEDPQLLYSTDILFRCSSVEKGPMFKEYKGCVTILTWETPHACPIDYYTGSNCNMNDRRGNRNLQKLFMESDRTFQFSHNETKLVYNLCGPTHSTCNNFSNVSFCLKTIQKEVVIGWDTRELISEKGHLKMELTGGLCANKGTSGQVIVNFICNYEAPSPAPTLYVLEESCKFNVTIYSSLACLQKNIFQNCVYENGNSCYNLNSLSSKRKNHVISHDQNVDFIFNLCGPIISGPDALCSGNAMFCLKNKSEVNIKHQFVSLGTVAGPSLHNNALIIESEMGTYCEGHGYYRSVLHLECSAVELLPVMVKKESCTYNFLWKTPEACPIQRNCVIRDSTSNMTLDLTSFLNTKLKINIGHQGEKYEFNLCSDGYIIKYASGTSNRYTLERNLSYRSNKTYLSFDLKNSCNISAVSKVNIAVECDGVTCDCVAQESFEDCILNIVIRKHDLCSHTTQKIAEHSSVENTTLVIPLQQIKLNSTSLYIKENNCSLSNEDSGYQFRLAKLKAQQISIQNNKYSINFDGSLTNCKGFLCKNGIEILPMHTCPNNVSKSNYPHDLIKLQFWTKIACDLSGAFELHILLKCNRTKNVEKIIERGTCKLVIEYNLLEVCPLFVEVKVLPTVKASAGPVAAIIGSGVGIVIMLSAIVIMYFNRHRLKRTKYQTVSHRPMSCDDLCRKSD